MTEPSAVRVVRTRRIGPFDFEILRYRPGSAVPRYSYEGFNLCIVLSGTCVERRGGATHVYRGPALTINVPSARHELEIGPDGTLCFSLDIDEAWVRDVADAKAAPVEPVVNLRDIRPLSAALRLRTALAERDDLALLTLESQLLEALGRARPSRRRGEPPAWLARVRERLTAEPRRVPALSELATEAGVHRVHLARSFRRFYGEAVGEYARRVRLQHAAAELAGSETSLGRIALRAGFYDQSHFNRRFKEVTGMTPGRFRHLVAKV